MAPSDSRPPTVPVIAIVLIAALAWLVGFLPGVLPDASPFDAGAMGELVAVAIVAGTLGGAAAAVRRDRPAAAIAAASGGVALIALATIHVLGERGVYLELVLRALQLITVLVVVVAVALGLVAALGPSWLRGLALAPLAGAAYSWFGQIVPPTSSTTHWWVWLMVPVLAGVLVLSVGRGPRGLLALLTWPFVLAGVWLVQTVIIALTAIGPMIRPGYGIEDRLDILFGEFLAYASRIFTTPGAHQVPLLAGSVVIALVVVVVRLAFDRRAGASVASVGEVEEPDVQADDEPVPGSPGSPRIRWVEILLVGFSLVLVLVALANVFMSYFCFAGAGSCGPPAAENVIAYRVILVLMALASLGALGLAVVRRSVAGVISHLVVASIVAVSAVLFAVPAIDWQRPSPEQPASERVDPEPPGAHVCYSGGDSDECPGG